MSGFSHLEAEALTFHFEYWRGLSDPGMGTS